MARISFIPWPVVADKSYQQTCVPWPPSSSRWAGRRRRGLATPYRMWSAGGRVVTASYDGTARIWDASSGQELLPLTGHTAGVWSAAFSPDGGRVVTASWDGTAHIWDASSG